ncbi:hypothetical protein C8R47DRAFT_721429 [Mycena vitilis]|nr:hypothetical protein C8R47DRAFT_721429 [Mycena vitilis]
MSITFLGLPPAPAPRTPHIPRFLLRAFPRGVSPVVPPLAPVTKLPRPSLLARSSSAPRRAQNYATMTPVSVSSVLLAVLLSIARLFTRLDWRVVTGRLLFLSFLAFPPSSPEPDAMPPPSILLNFLKSTQLALPSTRPVTLEQRSIYALEVYGTRTRAVQRWKGKGGSIDVIG